MKINGFGQLHRLLLNENYVINGGSVMDALLSLAITGGDYNWI